ncbi:hypothetical protein TNIN_362351 [Trichonephila inaurata madagascariensis]|uniref:Uncharacterized protein n=1 Tax=Trichonephila inaurata madagascariensis TaxID=2747483 RepID=A0A8X6XJL4_9ARAC|nr:hypothetical protein TNIN_362351 [Trichonephila inaurata madagascariensis]
MTHGGRIKIAVAMPTEAEESPRPVDTCSLSISESSYDLFLTGIAQIDWELISKHSERGVWGKKQTVFKSKTKITLPDNSLAKVS